MREGKEFRPECIVPARRIQITSLQGGRDKMGALS
jgi:hypothetical protein